MFLTPDQVDRSLSRNLWAQLISPRPIGLVSTVDRNGLANIAPFSSYTSLSTHPPMLGLSVGPGKSHIKRTLENVRSSGSFTVNLTPRFLADVMVRSAEDVEDIDDFERLGLTKICGETVGNCRIGESPAALECALVQIVPLPPSRSLFVVGRITGIHIRDEFWSERGFDPLAADLLACVGIEDYLSTNGELLMLPKTWD